MSQGALGVVMRQQNFVVERIEEFLLSLDRLVLAVRN
jgi:hypothetical protein